MASSEPRILTFDIETFPLVGYAWSIYQTNIIKIIHPSVMCGWSAKWLDGKQITRTLADYPGYKPGSRDDSKLARELWGLFEEADILVAHNGDDFDVKKVNARFILHGLTPPPPYKTIDTKKQAKKIFGFDSNRLDDLARFLGIGEKKSTGGFDLWEDCMAGKITAWDKMRSYNAHDVRLTEKVYVIMRPWIKPHPNLGLWAYGLVCPRCGSGKIQFRGTRKNETTEYDRIFCKDCKGWARGNHNIRRGKPVVAI